MTPGDVSRVLTKAAAFDQRTIGEADVLAWHEALGDLDLTDALTAVTKHYRDTTDRIMPAHIRRIVGEVERERRTALLAAATEAPECEHLVPGGYVLHPDTQQPRCPLCRRRAIAAATPEGATA